MTGLSEKELRMVAYALAFAPLERTPSCPDCGRDSLTDAGVVDGEQRWECTECAGRTWGASDGVYARCDEEAFGHLAERIADGLHVGPSVPAAIRDLREEAHALSAAAHDGPVSSPVSAGAALAVADWLEARYGAPEQTALWLATMETEHYSWHAAGASEADAFAALARAWEAHRAQVATGEPGLAAAMMSGELALEHYGANVTELALDQGYRDGEPVR